MTTRPLTSVAWRVFPWFAGAVLFLIVTGGGILKPTYLDWLMFGDTAQHWIGWQFFRQTPLLQWPLGANRGLGMELGNSIVFSDSIPLMAFIFKYLNPLLPEQFQYFGLWILLCFCLQAHFASKLLSRFTDSRVLIALGTLLFAIAPAALWRLHGHYALLSHWTLLAGLYLYTDAAYRNRRWALLLAVTSLIHAYLLAMLLALWIVDLAQRVLRKQLSLIRTMGLGAGTLVMLALIMWAAGYFMIGGGVSSGGFGVYRLNLLSVFDADGMWSATIPDINGEPGDYEGFNFLGSGMLILMAVALVGAALNRSVQVNKASCIPLALLCIGLFIYALSNKVALGSSELFEYSLPDPLLKLGETFRASGRFFWPVYYALYLFTFWSLFSRLKHRVAVAACALALVIQAVDMKSSWVYFHEKFDAAPVWHSPLSAPIWNEFPHHYKKVVLLLPTQLPAAWLELSHYAGTHHMRTNAGYFPRIDQRKLDKTTTQLIETVDKGTFRDDTLYIFENDYLWKLASTRATDAYVVGAVDGFRFLAPGLKQCETCDWTGLVPVDVVNRPPFTTGVFDFTPGGNGTHLRNDGWADAGDWGTWSDGDVAHLQFTPAALEAGRPLELKLEASGYVSGAHTQQRVDVLINGAQVGKMRFSIADPGGVRKILLPPQFAEQTTLPLNIEFRMHDAISPEAIGAGKDPRRLGFNLKSLELRTVGY